MTDADGGTDLNIGTRRNLALDKMGLSDLGVDGDALMDNVTSAKDALGSMTDGLGRKHDLDHEHVRGRHVGRQRGRRAPMFNYAAEMKRFDGARPVNPFQPCTT